MKSDQFYISELEDKILDTVYEYTASVPRPFGVIVSGGFDSGLLAALTHPDYVYSVRFPFGSRYDESRYADSIIDHLHLREKTTIITFTKEDFMPNLREGVKIMGEPIAHFSLAPFNLLMKKIGERFTEANILSGEGPDEYLGGYARQIIFDELQKLYEIPELRNYHETIEKVIGHDLIWKYGEMMGYEADKVANYVDSELPLQGAIGKMDMDLGIIEKMEQKLAGAYDVTLHYPYINNLFAEYCYKLPDHLKVRNGITKWAFRQVCKKYLPEMMWDRGKMGGPVAPVNQWLGKPVDGEFDKRAYLEVQKEILDERT